MEWLSHSNKKYCELCKTPFRFTKLYDSHMPTTLPLHIFLRKAAMHSLRYLLTWARGLAVGLVWLVLLPWCIRWSWRGLFWLLDAGWARDAWLAKEENLALRTSIAPSLADTVANTLNHTQTTTPRPDTQSEPIALNLSKMLIGALLNPWRPFTNYKSIESNESASVLAHAATSTLLSDVKSLNNVTNSPSMNRFILDVLEGQIVTFLIVIAFILVFLIREWVVQQQPIINAAAQLRDAELQVEVVDQAAQRLRARQIQPLPALEGANLHIREHAAREPAQELVQRHLDQDNASDSDPDETRTSTQGTNTQSPEYPPNLQPEFEGADNHADDLQDDEATGATRRPVMPLRHSSARVNQVLQAMEEEPTDNFEARDADSTGSGDSWQAIEDDLAARDAAAAASLGLGSRNKQNGDHILEPYHDDDQTSTTAVLSEGSIVGVLPDEETEARNENNFEPSTVSNVRDSEEHDEPILDIEPIESDPEQREPFQGPDLSQTARPAEQMQQNNQIVAAEALPGNIVQRTFDWFWADIVPDVDDPAPPHPDPFDEAIVQNEAEEPPFMHIPVDQVEPAPNQPNDNPGQDLEVLQAAAEAGLDADAMDDVEDLEGILELIGMQGPLVGLLQTAMFCGVLITTTLWAALGAPYLFGKFALLFLGDPLVFSITAPLRAISLVADAIVDSTIYVGGLITYFTAEVLSQLSAWVLRAFSKQVEAKSFDFLATRAHDAIVAAGGRLSNLVTGDSPFETGFFMVSLHAHQSLQTLQLETAQATAFVVRLSAAISSHLQSSTIGQILHSAVVGLVRESVQMVSYYSWAQEYFRSNFAANINNGTFTLTVTRDHARLDPSLAYWSATDRCLTILAGYVFLAMIGTMYLLRKEPLFSSPSLQQVEKGFTDFLKQAGGVLKVILIISIEMLVFPLYCGMLLDCALLPLFRNASIGSRLLFGLRSPWMFAFVHWFIGTCYMFHFALFVSACRRVMRTGVLYFIRDPDDPTFHPVRDVLERNVTTQLRKIAFSALVYGGLVICCLGGVVWGINFIFPTIFPIRWATPEPLLEFPIDFLTYNLLAPLVTRFVLPSQGLEDLFKLWLKRCARALRLSHFLFGERQRDEEGHRVRRSQADMSGSDVDFIHDGKYVRAPASDQVRIPKGDRVFLQVTDDNKRVDGQEDSRNGLHGRHNKNFTKVYIPPYFRVRIALFIFSLWFFAAATGVGITVVPMVFGRVFLPMVMPERVAINDLYAFSAGLITLGGTLCVLLRSKGAYTGLRANLSKDKIRAGLDEATDHISRMLKSIYVYGFALIVVPSLFALVLQLYLILPLHTYTSSWSSGSSATNTLSSAPNATASAIPTLNESSAPSLIAGHTIHILQDWTLGFLYGRVVLRLLMLSRNSRPATALRMITRDGYTNPNAKLATRAFIAPTLLLFAVILLCPPVLAMAANSLLLAVNFPTESFPQALRVKVYRYSYPICASQVFALWCAWEVIKATQRWRNRIKDEVYLIGERLHNFGEKRPPEGSRGAIRRGR